MHLIVKTFDLTSGLQTTARHLNMTDYGAWTWISKQVAWACNNQHGVQVINADDEPPVESNVVELKRAA